MSGGRARRWLGLSLTAATLVALFAAPAGAAMKPRARAFRGMAAVGALFMRGTNGALRRHFCSATVVNSPGGDLVVTAAHCLDGRPPSRVAFVPGYADGREPYGVWLVRKVIRDKNWTSKADPDHDVAFLIVAQPGDKRTLQSLTGGEGLSIPEPGEQVLTIGYPDSRGQPVRCVNALRAFGPGQVEFDCGGYTDGTSGGPLLTDVDSRTGLGEVVGVIGGYEQGGYTDSVSYAARFGHQVAALYHSVTHHPRQA